MSDYRLFFLDDKGAIQARQEFVAEQDLAAVILSSLVWQACSDVYAGYDLWCFNRRVVCALDGIGLIPPPLLEQTAREMQERILVMECELQRSRWRVAKSSRLAKAAETLRGLLNKPGEAA